VSLTPGTRVGPYEVLAPLGAGGMGEVFRAHDTRLARDVAVKVLPTRLSEDGEALARFEREAKAVAALSHPNILAIFDFGRADGIAYAVTELLEGESLRERLKPGAFPERKAAECAIQIAHGLAAAHEKGIVHRDLKPENVFVSRDGRVKILDFGLARLAGAGAVDDDSGSPTEAHHTEPGTVLGTVGYMSPEQVRGQPVDHRSDIFSLGSVLFELATGGPAFKRDTSAETMTAILRDDPLDAPEPASRSSRLTPGLERILRHCLEKAPEERFQSARDLAFDLEALSGTTRSGTTAAVGAARTRLRVSPLLAGAAALTLLGLGFGLGRLGRGSAGAAASPLLSFTQLTFQAGALRYPSVSPEGQSFVFVGESGGDLDIQLQRVGGTNPLNLTADSEAEDSEPAFSPDGSQIAFRSERDGGGIFLMGATGESVRRLTHVGRNPAWSPDGTEIVYSTETIQPFYPYARAGFGELWAVKVASGEKRRLTPDSIDAVQPSWSPHGDRIAYWGLRTGGQRDLWTVARSGGESSVVSVTDDPDLDWNPVWAPDGRSLFFASDRGGTMGVFRLSIDESSGRTSGVPQPLHIPLPFACYLSLTRDGRRMLLASATGTDSIERLAFDPTTARVLGPASTLFESSLRLFWVSASADGERIAISTGGRREDLYDLQRDGTGLRQLTNDPHKDRGPTFFPDGRQLLFYSNRSGQYEAWSVRLDGSGLTQLTRTVGSEATEAQLSPDGSLLALNLDRGLALARLGATLPVSPEPMPPPGEGGVFEYPRWSRDGQRLAGILKLSSGRQSPAIFSLASRTYRSFDVEGTDPVHWVGGDRSILFMRMGRILAVEVDSGRVRDVLGPERPGAGRAPAPIFFYNLSADERTLHLIRSGNQADIWQVTLP
jgi:Tol biopolymer transport system component